MNAWEGKYDGDFVVEVAGSTATILSPSNGHGLDAPLGEPCELVIDASGNFWISNASSEGGNTLTQFIGLAGPIKTKLLWSPVQP